MNAQAQQIRKATLDDLPRGLELAKIRYPDRDIGSAERWVRLCIQHPDRLVLVGRACFGIAAVDWYYGMERRGYLAVLFSMPDLSPGLEAMAMIAAMVDWARENDAEPPFMIEADTGVDFGPFVARLGGRLSAIPKYEIPF